MSFFKNKLNEEKHFKAKHAFFLTLAILVGWILGYFVFVGFMV